MVRVRDIAEALEHSVGCVCCYDRATDSIVKLPEGSGISFVEEDSGTRYVPIEADPDLEFRIMADFAEAVDDPGLSMKLDAALSRRGAADNFSDVVAEARMEKLWRSFRRNRYDAEAEAFCEMEGIGVS